MRLPWLETAADAAVNAAFLAGCLALAAGGAAAATTEGDGVRNDAGSTLPRLAEQPKEQLYLEVYINGYRTNSISSVRRYRDGCLTMERRDLAGYRLKTPESAVHASGGVCLERVPGLTYRYDEPAQAIHLTAPDALRETLEFDARGRKPDTVQADSAGNLSAIFNYALTGNFYSEDLRKNFIPNFQGAGVLLDAHLFSDYGNFDQSATVRSEVTELQPSLLRLDTRWFYNDASAARTYAAGDIISGSFDWTRSVRMGGVQIKSDFALRPDLVTQAIPTISGSAAVPSTVEVYANQSHAFSQQVSGGPFTISNLPIISGPDTLKLVVRDASGRETATEYAYYASPLLLASGLTDYSAEGGFARTFYGVNSDSYNDNPIASGSLRYGVTNRLTLQAHAEGGAGLANIGGGAAFGLWHYGVASFAASGSDTSGNLGGQVSGSFETSVWGARLYARSLRSLGDYQDLAAVTAPKQQLNELFGSRIAAASGAVYKRQDQISLSIPLSFDNGSLNFSYTDAEDAVNNAYKIASVSYSRPFIWKSTFFINGYNDFDRGNSWGAYAGLTFAWDNYSTGAIAQASAGSYSAGGYLSRNLSPEADSYGYTIRAQEGSLPVNSASVAYRSQEVKVEAGVQQTGKSSQVTASAEGSIAFLNGVYIANRIDNSFAVVDTGIPGVTVLHENHPVGQTDATGSILIPSMRAHEPNAITIDAATLPAEADIDVTDKTVVPRQRGGISIHFKGVAKPASAIVAFKDEKGAPIAAGSEVWVNGAPDPFVIGYDGEAYITNLAPSNKASVKLPDGAPCEARFDYAAPLQGQARIENAICAASTQVFSSAQSAGLTVMAKR